MTSRRQFLGTTSVLAGSVLLGRPARVFAAPQTGGSASMSKRSVPSSGELIPVIDMGTSGSFQVPIGSAQLGFGGLLIIILIIGLQSVIQLTRLGESIDVILRENYRSVIAYQDMKEALERMDSGILFTMLGYSQEGAELIRKNESASEKALQIELNNITLPGEQERALHIQELFTQFRGTSRGLEDPSLSLEKRREVYFTRLLPLFQQIKATADEILHMNQHNMIEANDRARTTAAAAKHRMYFLLRSGAVVAVLFVLFTGRWILRPMESSLLLWRSRTIIAVLSPDL